MYYPPIDEERLGVGTVKERLTFEIGNHRSKHVDLLLKEHTEIQLRKAPDFESWVRKYVAGKNGDVPENTNLSFQWILEFQRIAQDVRDLQTVVKTAGDIHDRVLALRILTHRRQELDEYLEPGLMFKQAYAEYIRSESDFREFMAALRGTIELKKLLTTPAFASLPDDPGRDMVQEARLEKAVRRFSANGDGQGDSDTDALLAELATLCPKSSGEYKEVKQLLGRNGSDDEHESIRSKRDLKEALDTLQDRAEELWEDPMVRTLFQAREFEELRSAYHEGADVLENQSVIGYLNQLHEWECQHRRTTVGGVLVGAPGVGKTTLLRHYLELKGRNYVYLDLSEDVTRYMLYGMRSMEVLNPAERQKSLIEVLSGFSEEEFARFITENATALTGTLSVSGEEATVTAIHHVEELLREADGNGKLPGDEIRQIQATLTEVAQRTFRRELASEFGRLVGKRGWRDGMIIAALRRGDCPIFDEANKCKNWSLIYSLMTAKPGEDWYFAENDEYIHIPEHWRMYFTGNIGKKHGVFTMPEAFVSRASGKIMEITPPPKREEMRVALVALANSAGDFLLSREDLAKLVMLITDVFPKIRNYVKDKPQSVPISYRTIRDIAEKLVLYRDINSGKHIFHRTDKSFDQAAYDVLIQSYAIYEDAVIPKQIAVLATAEGLLLDDVIENEVKALVGEETYDANKKAHTDEANRDNFNEIVKQIRGITRDVSGLAFPKVRAF